MQLGSLASLVMSFHIQHLWGGVCSVVVPSALGQDPPNLFRPVFYLCVSPLEVE